MCGIVGFRLTHEPARREQIEAMNATIVHRGPDGDGVFTEGTVGLGMRRLSIIDLEGGWQPIPNETGRIQVIQNGEIYNYRELKQELESLGHTFRTSSDTEVAVHAYEEFGGFEFAKRLRGMFAIAIWDNTTEELWLARDRVGIKPFYYAETDRGFTFASEVKALLAGPVLDAAFEPRALSQYLVHGSAGIEDSFVKGVRQLRPGHVLRHNGKAIDIRPYWEFRFPETQLDVSEAEAIELLKERLHETVRAHLVSDVPVGAFLSGGIDSGAIVGLMAAEGSKGFKTFSIGFLEDDFNELPYARQVAEKYGTDHHEEIVRPDAVKLMDKLSFHLDEPFADASAIPTWYVSELAAREVKVVLSGDGGDELFAGYNRYAAAARHAYLDSVPRFLRSLGSWVSGFLPSGFPGRFFLDYCGHDRQGRYLYSGSLIPPPFIRKLLRPEFHPERLGAPDPIAAAVDVLKTCGAPDAISECMHYDIVRYLPLDILIKVDRMTMAHSLEARPPLLDHEFMEFAASLPLPLKITEDGRRKYILKKTVEPLLPPALLDRPKSGFSVPLQAWFKGPLRPMFEQQVLEGGRSLDYLRPGVLRLLLDENARGRRDHGLKLWAILVLELWLRRSV